MLHSLNDHLTDTLGCSHDIRWIHGFVRRNENHAFRTGSSCRHRYIISSKYIVLDGLIRAVFHKWHMLVCSCMKNNCRFIICKYGIYPMRVSHRSNEYDQIQLWKVLFQFLLKIIGSILINIENDKLRRMMRRDLPAKLATYRTSTTGNQHDFSCNISHHFIQIRLYRFPSEEIFNLYLTEIRYGYFLIDNLCHTRQNLNLTSGVLAELQDFLFSCSRKIRNCNKNLPHTILFGSPWNFAVISHNRGPKDLASDLILICINDTSYAVTDLRTVLHIFDKKVCAVSCTDHHRRNYLSHTDSKVIMTDNTQSTIHKPAPGNQCQ